MNKDKRILVRMANGNKKRTVSLFNRRISELVPVLDSLIKHTNMRVVQVLFPANGKQ